MRVHHLGRSFLMLPSFALLVGLVVIPLATLFYFSLYEQIHPLKNFTTAQYHTLVHVPLYGRVLWKTIYTVALVTGITLAIGWPAGWIISRLSPRRQIAVIALVVIPYLTSYLLLLYSMFVVIAPRGPLMAALGALHLANAQSSILYTPWATIVMLVYEGMPIMILVMYAGSERIPTAVLQAGRSLGAGRLSVFRRIILPLSGSSVITGAALVFVPSLGAFAEPAILGGPHGVLIGNLIEDQINVVGDEPFAAALCFVLLGLVSLAGLVVWLALRYARRQSVLSQQTPVPVG